MSSNIPEFSRTIRIDLIPETPSKPVVNKRRVVLASSGRSSKAKQLSDSKADRYKALLESIYDAALITNLDGKIIDANTRASDFLHYDKDELLGQTIQNFVSGAEKSLLTQLVKNLEKQTFVLIQAYCQCKDGSHFPSEIAVARIRTGEDNLGFFIRDITWRRQAEEMLRTEHNALQNAANGIAIANLDGLLEYVNPAFAALMETQAPSLLTGMNIRELFDGSDIADELMHALQGKSGSWSREVSAEMPSGALLDLQILANCNRNSDGDVVGFVFSFSDLSDRKKAELAQREIEKNQVMLESLGTACHHLGQPATLLMGNLSLLQDKVGKGDPVVEDLLKSSADAITRLGEILHKLNKVNEYRTTTYMDHGGPSSGETTNILDI